MLISLSLILYANKEESVEIRGTAKASVENPVEIASIVRANELILDIAGPIRVLNVDRPIFSFINSETLFKRILPPAVARRSFTDFVTTSLKLRLPTIVLSAKRELVRMELALRFVAIFKELGKIVTKDVAVLPTNIL